MLRITVTGALNRFFALTSVKIKPVKEANKLKVAVNMPIDASLDGSHKLVCMGISSYLILSRSAKEVTRFTCFQIIKGYIILSNLLKAAF